MWEGILAKIKEFLEGRWFSVEKEITWTGYTKPETPAPQPTPVVPKAVAGYTRESFTDALKPAAEMIQSETGIPWVFAVCQAGHESRNGNSQLTREANNLFGITGESWADQGKPVYWIETKEFNKDKQPFMIKRPFRRYRSWEDSLRDWASLIKRKYPVSYKAAMKGDFAEFAHGLQAGGYATDPKYALKLSGVFRYYEEIAIARGYSPSKSKPGATGDDSKTA